MRYEELPVLPSRSWAGNVADLVEDRLGMLQSLSTREGLLRGRVMHIPILFCNTPETAHEVLVEKAKFFEKSPGLRLLLHYFAGQGLFTSEGDLWKRQRKRMAPLFHPGALQQYARSMNGCAARAAARWQDGQRLDLAHEMTRITMAVVGETLFGADTFDEADELGEALTTALQWTNDRLGSRRILPHILAQDAVKALTRRAPEALQGGLRQLQNRLEEPFLLEEARSPKLQGAIARLDARVQEMIDERRKDSSGHQDLLARLLKARDEDESGDQGMSDRQVRDETMTLFIAGHETTATALSWSFYLLARNPEAMARAQAEADAFDEAGPTRYEPERLAFLTRVFKEALRLYPPVVLLPKRTLQEVEIGGYTLRPRTLTFVSPYTIHLRPEIYPEPDRFDPDRWLPEQEARRHKSAFLPFGAGPRVCIGNYFALMEGPIVMATLLRKMRLEIDPRREIVPDDFASLRPAGGVPAVVHPRSP
jgi:cytochrome P450